MREIQTMREIQLKDAKASLSSLVDDATRGETAIVASASVKPS